MTGEPQLGSNPFIGIDSTLLTITDLDAVPSGLILNSASPFQLSARWELGGSFALWIVGLGVAYTVTYYADQVGGPGDMVLGTVPGNTAVGQLVYDSPATTLTVPPGGLAAGIYKLAASISFGGAPPMVAFIEGPMVEVF
jgi:hypothetical protein